MALPDRDADVKARVGITFVLAIGAVWWPTWEALPSLFMENRNLLRKELRAGAHRLSAFYIARVLTLHPIVYAVVLAPNTIIALMAFAAFPSASQIFYIIFGSVLIASVYVAIGLFFSAMVPDQHLVLTVLVFLM